MSGGAITFMDPALVYFRKVTTETNGPLARALAPERELICEFLRSLSAPHVPLGTGGRPRRVMSEAGRHGWGITRTLPRLACSRRDLWASNEKYFS